MKNQELCKIGWKPFFHRQVSPDHSVAVTTARVSAHYGSHVLLLGAEGEFRVPVQLVESVGEIAVGDWLVLEAEDCRAIQRLERQTLLYRKASGEKIEPQLIAANIDTIFIVSSCNEDFNLSRIERYLALVLQADATPVVVLTKADLCETAVDFRQQAHNSRSLAERRERERKTGRMYKSIIADKRRRRDEP